LDGDGEVKARLNGTATNVIQHNPAKGWHLIVANPQATPRLAKNDVRE
jgi:hypothetical protein